MSEINKTLTMHEYSLRDKLRGYEKIRTVGKGAYGTACLYKRLSDGQPVVIKEINLMDMSAFEKEAALNEVKVLSSLDHPNIISYYSSFERDGSLMIEMEYADGGTLAQKLQTMQDSKLEEYQILDMFKQIVAAISYMHGHNILHRDLKTANVFLNKDGSVKVGDFGISKMMTTRAQAHTVLGTPYYISPEMCEGKEYDQKSDIWAMGCILYEMTCLEKPFQGTNLPALVNKIMKGIYEPVSKQYSSGLRNLIGKLLQKEPAMRPDAMHIEENILPLLLNRSLFSSLTKTKTTKNSVRSVIYELISYENKISLKPIDFPALKVTQLSVSNTHFIALTSDLTVYTWGDGKKGQLAHGYIEKYTDEPKCVEELKGKSIKKISAGDNFSIFLNDSGIVMSCGDGAHGCLGHSNWDGTLEPRIIETLLTANVVEIASGSRHVIALTATGDLYTWGSGEDGRLGQGHHENCCTPKLVKLPTYVSIKSIYCGFDCSFVLSNDGLVYACGNNCENKLGLLDKRQFFENNSKIVQFSKVKNIGEYFIIDIAVGPFHTALITTDHCIITMGRNFEGQLGRGHSRMATGPKIVDIMKGKAITHVKCGPTYTVVGTADNVVYFWGTRYKDQNMSDHDLLFALHPPEADDSGSSEASNRTSISFQSTRLLLNASQMRQNSLILNRDNSPSFTDQVIAHQLSELVLEPVPLLALYSSPDQAKKNKFIILKNLVALKNTVLILVETNVPQPQEEDTSSAKTILDQSSDEESYFNQIPEWLNAEVAMSEFVWTGH